MKQISLAWQFSKGVTAPIIGATKAEHFDEAVGANVVNRLSVDCDCNGHPAEPDMHDIGILASIDPVALDQACVDLVYAAPDGKSLINRIESRNGLLTLEHAEKTGNLAKQMKRFQFWVLDV